MSEAGKHPAIRCSGVRGRDVAGCPEGAYAIPMDTEELAGSLADTSA